jgi:hypothetical protein
MDWLDEFERLTGYARSNWQETKLNREDRKKLNNRVRMLVMTSREFESQEPHLLRVRNHFKYESWAWKSPQAFCS